MQMSSMNSGKRNRTYLTLSALKRATHCKQIPKTQQKKDITQNLLK